MSKDHSTGDETHGPNEPSTESSAATSAGDADSTLPAVLTADDLAKLARVDRRVIYEMVREHQIPGVRPFGRQLRFDRDCVLNWLRDGQGRAPRSAPRS